MRVQEDIHEITIEADLAALDWTPVLKVGKNWDLMVRRVGRNHGKGPVHIYYYMALLKTVMKHGNLDPQKKQIIQQFVDTHKSIKALVRDIPVCIIKQVYNKPKVLVTTHVRQQAIAAWQVVQNFLEQSGAQDLPGTAPRGPIFRGIAEELQQLMS